MHRTISAISKRFIEIKPGEGRKVWLTFLYFFLIITAYYVIKPVSRSLVLDGLGSRMVPYVDLISAVLMGPMVTLFAHLVDRMEKPRLLSLTFWALIANLVIFWKCLQQPGRWVSAGFYVWVAIFSVLVVTLFWLVANDLYHPREAKRLFGFIGSGGILGGIVGSSIAAGGARLLGTEQLLLLSALLLLLSWIVVERLWRFAPALAEPASVGPVRPQGPTPFGSTARQILSSRYLLLLVGLVAIAKIVSTLIYYQFNPFIERMFPSADAKTAFTGLFFGWMNIAAFVVQFFLTSWVLRRLGLTCALLALPVGLLGGAAGLLAGPVFWLAAAAELYDGSMNYSLQQTTKEVLYLPIERSVRYKVKPFIDMGVFRLGKGLAAIMGIVVLDLLHLEARVFGFITLPLIGLWIVLAIQLHRGYIRRIRALLQGKVASTRTRSAERTAHPFAVVRAGPAPDLESWLEANSLRYTAREKFACIAELISMDGALADGGKPLLEALMYYEQRPDRMEVADPPPSVEYLTVCIRDPHQPMATRRDAIKRLVQQDGQDAADCLVGMMLVEEDAAMRHELLRGLTKLRLRYGRAIEFPKRLIRRQIGKEVQTYQRILEVAAMCHDVTPNRAQEMEPIATLLRLLAEETIQRIFRLLALIYRPDDIYLIYNQLQEPDRYLRADAIEFLDNLVDPGLRKLIFPVLDEDWFLEGLSRAPGPSKTEDPRRLQVLREIVWDQDRWLSVAGMSLIGRLRLEPLLPELERARKSGLKVLALAAQVATHLATESRSPSS